MECFIDSCRLWKLHAVDRQSSAMHAMWGPGVVHKMYLRGTGLPCKQRVPGAWDGGFGRPSAAWLPTLPFGCMSQSLVCQTFAAGITLGRCKGTLCSPKAGPFAGVQVQIQIGVLCLTSGAALLAGHITLNVWEVTLFTSEAV